MQRAPRGLAVAIAICTLVFHGTHTRVAAEEHAPELSLHLATPDGLYHPGSTLDVDVRMDYIGVDRITALALELRLPAEWTYAASIAGDTPQFAPATGVGGTLAFGWVAIPDFPLAFTCRVHVPATATGTRRISGLPNYRTDGGVIVGSAHTISLAQGDVVPEGEEDEEGGVEGEGAAPEGEGDPGLPPRHNADRDGDGRISLSELLRAIQFYNSPRYGCLPGSEDGFAPSATDESCDPHASDYNPQDWRINLSELLRLIQFYNSDGFHACPEAASEDGYCVGPSA